MTKAMNGLMRSVLTPGIASGLLPAIRAARLPIATAIRDVQANPLDFAMS